MKKSKRIFSVLLAVIMTLSCFACLGMLSGAAIAEKKWVVTEESEYENGVKVSKTTTKYDSNGNIISDTYKNSDGYSRTKTYVYDSRGNLLKETKKDSDGDKRIDLYEYDKKGKLVKYIRDSERDDPTVTTYEYDSYGNEIKETIEDDGYIETYIHKYDKKGNLLKDAYEDSEGEFSSYDYTYDSKGNQTSESYKDSDGDDWSYTYEYNSNGKKIKDVYKVNGKWSGTRTYEYDSKGNLIKEKTKDKSGYNGTITTEYDSKGNEIKSTYKSSEGDWEKWAWEYDSKGNLIKRTCKESSGYSYSGTLKYNSLNLLVEERTKYSDGSTDIEKREYDSFGNLLSQKYESKDSDYNYSYTRKYTYDETGNLIKSVEKDDSGYTETTTYSYDAQGNLIKEKYKDSSGYYHISEYDKYGNRLKEVSFDPDDDFEYKTVSKYELVKGTPEYAVEGDISIELPAESFAYSGKAIYPAVDVIIRYSEDEYDYGYLERGIDYTVKYTNNVKVGTATVAINLKGVYTGTIKKTFKISPQSTSISSVTAGTKKMTVKWNKQATQTTGYQIQYSTSSSFAADSTKTVNVKDNTTTSKTISSLKSGTTYYVRVRTYKTVDGKNYYSSWSSKKSVTVK